MTFDRRGGVVLLLGLVMVAVLFLPGWSVEQRLGLALAAVACLGLLLGRAALGRLDLDDRWDMVDLVVVGLGFGGVALTVMTLALAALPGPLNAGWLLGGVLVLLMAGWWAGSSLAYPWPAVSRQAIVHALIVVAIAAPLRLVDLGFSEFQGDEASILHRAAALSQGIDAALLAHRKGPGEILLVSFFGMVAGRVTEADVRLPFALVSVASAVGVYAAGRAAFGAWAGLLAGVLWAVNGYAVGFGRIIQYHSVVVLLSAIALMCAWRAEAPALPSGQRWALRRLALVLVAFGLVFGFNALILGLPALLLVGAALAADRGVRGWRPRLCRPGRADLPFIALGLAGLMYLALEWRDLVSYLGSRLGRGQPFNNLDLFARVSVRYLGQPYLLGLAGAFVAGIVWLALRSGTSRWHWPLAVGIVAGPVLLILLGGEPTALAIVVWLVMVVPLLVPSRLDRSWRVLGLGALLPLGLYTFLIREPGTHWYEAYLAATLMCAGLVVLLVGRLRGLVRVAAVGGVTAALAIAGLHPVYAFLPLWPIDAPMPGEALYRPAWRAERVGGSFGFPHQDGLKAASLIFDLGYMAIPYQSNASPEVTRWYLPMAERCDRPRGSFITLFSERRPDDMRRGADTWVINVRGIPRAVVRDFTANPRPLAQLAVEAPTTWFDERYARLDRPLTIPQRACPRPMRPAWVRN